MTALRVHPQPKIKQRWLRGTQALASLLFPRVTKEASRVAFARVCRRAVAAGDDKFVQRGRFWFVSNLAEFALIDGNVMPLWQIMRQPRRPDGPQPRMTELERFRKYIGPQAMSQLADECGGASERDRWLETISPVKLRAYGVRIAAVLGYRAYLAQQEKRRAAWLAKPRSQRRHIPPMSLAHYASGKLCLRHRIPYKSMMTWLGIAAENGLVALGVDGRGVREIPQNTAPEWLVAIYVRLRKSGLGEKRVTERCRMIAALAEVDGADFSLRALRRLAGDEP